MRKARMLFLVLFIIGFPSVSFGEGVAEGGEANSKSKLERTRDIIDSRANGEASPIEPSEPISQWPKMLQGLMLSLGLFSVFVYFMKKGKRTLGTLDAGRMEVVERLALSQKMSVALVRIDQREVLLGMSGDRLTTIPLGSEPFEIQALESDIPVSLVPSKEAACGSN